MSNEDLQFGLTGTGGLNAWVGILVSRVQVGDLPAVVPDLAQEQAELLGDEVDGLLGHTKESLKTPCRKSLCDHGRAGAARPESRPAPYTRC